MAALEIFQSMPEEQEKESAKAAEPQVRLIDTHAHIDGEAFDGDRAEMLERAKEAGLVAVINFGDSMASSERGVELAAEYEMVYTGVGVHPEEAVPFTAADDDRLVAWTQEKRVIAIGEIGLDYYWEKDEDKRKLQRDIFVRQLDLARQLHLPVCIHDREAHGDMMKILKTEGKGIPGVMHCYSGSYEMAMDLLRLGFYLGIDGPLTYKNAVVLPQMLPKLPADRLLVETDSPYLTPMPLRGKVKRNEPAFVRYTAECAARLRGESLEDFAAQTTRNACDLYGLTLT